MSCDKCFGKYHEEDDDLNVVTFPGVRSYDLCDRCTRQAHEYVRDWF